MVNLESKRSGRVTLLCSLVVALISISGTFAQEATDVMYETVTYDGHHFSIPDTQLPWAEAKDACKTRGQLLASVETPEKDDILVQLFSEHLHTNVTLKGNSWISAAEVREGVWHWDSLDKPVYHKRWFMDGQPDDKENLNCVYLASTAMLYWRDANCSASMYYICEGEPKEPEAESGAGYTPVFATQVISIVLLSRLFIS